MKRFDIAQVPTGGIMVESEEDGDYVLYDDVDAALTSAYAEGRTDESKEMAGPLMLMRDAFDLLESHLGDSEVEYEDDDEEREYAPVQVAARLLMGAILAMQGGKR